MCTRVLIHSVCAILLLLSAGCTGASSYEELPVTPLLETDEVASLTVDEAAIVKAVIDTLFAVNDPEKRGRLKQTKPTVFLQIFDKNPGDDLLRSFHVKTRTIKPAHEGRMRGSVFDPETDQMAELLAIEEIKQPGEGTAKVKLYTYHGPLAAAGFAFHLIQSERGWKVAKSEMLWIS